jgi:defect-in-organelle-trafficking protein DotC
MKWLLTVTTLFLFILSSCATTQQRIVNPTNLKDLENLTQKHPGFKQTKIGKIRLDALKEIAMGLGAQGGLSQQATQINAMLERSKKQLSRTFNFNGLMLEHNVLPPVIQESKQSLQLNGPDIIRTSTRTYKIIQQARFVTTAPTWRDYLWLNYNKPELPDITLLPRTKAERAIWIEYVNLGWKKGIEQANNIHQDNLERLRTDFEGMLLYRKLLTQNIVTKPILAKSNMGITSNDDNSELYIDDRIIRITAVPTINTDNKQWKPVLIQR